MRDVIRERDEADRAYNDALTSLDRSVVTVGEPLPPVVAGDVTLPPPPSPMRRWLRRVFEWLAPLFSRQHAYNARVAAAFEQHAARERERAVAFERMQTALMIFLQRITAFVDTKDRAVAAELADSLDRCKSALDAVTDLQAQVAVLQRSTQKLLRDQQSIVGFETDVARGFSRAEAGLKPGATGFETGSDDWQYVGFEDRYRGSDDEVREKLRAYLPIFTGASDVLDVGCGRGEFLALLKADGVRACGVDINREMVATARQRDLDVVESDALRYLASRPDNSLGGLMAAQVVEHLEPEYLLRFLKTAFDKLRPGAPIVVETINPACWLAFFSSYIRDVTHVRPLHPDTLEYLLQANGFGRVKIQYSAPVPAHMKMQAVALPPELAGAAETINANAAILNNLMFTYLDYAAVAYRS